MSGRCPGTPIAETFAALRRNGRRALIPFVTAGFPSRETFCAMLRGAAGAGADLFEVGIPFSDPLADGPAIQESSRRAIERGVTLAAALELLREETAAAAARSEALPPLLVMSYVNPLLGMGWRGFAEAAAASGVAGVIVPDLPMEEGKELAEELSARMIDLVLLAAPTTGEARLRELGRRSRGFLYLVSVTGVTGARAGLPADLDGFARRAREASELPLCLGFGIAGPEQAASAAQRADGVIVGSALVERLERGGEREALDLLRAMRAALDGRA